MINELRSRHNNIPGIGISKTNPRLFVRVDYRGRNPTLPCPALCPPAVSQPRGFCCFVSCSLHLVIIISSSSLLLLENVILLSCPRIWQCLRSTQSPKCRSFYSTVARYLGSTPPDCDLYPPGSVDHCALRNTTASLQRSLVQSREPAFHRPHSSDARPAARDRYRTQWLQYPSLYR